MLNNWTSEVRKFQVEGRAMQRTEMRKHPALGECKEVSWASSGPRLLLSCLVPILGDECSLPSLIWEANYNKKGVLVL